jgi:dihydrofolate synthase/folylpolyglutamate synthase
MDHEKFLGHTLEEVAFNKFGVIPPRGPWAPEGALVVHAALDPVLATLARETRLRTGSHWLEAPEHELRVLPPARPGAEPEFRLRTRWGECPLRLPGERGAENAALALGAFEAFGGDPEAQLHALGNVRWPGRMQRVAWPEAPCAVYLSGDHNPQGVESLLSLLGHYPRRRIHFLIGIGQDKASGRMLELFRRVPDCRLFLTETPFRGLKIADYPAQGSGPGSVEGVSGAWADPATALSEVARQASPGDLIVVTGSLYLVGKILSVL